MPALNVIAAVLLVSGTAVYGLTTLSASVPRWIALYLWAALACSAFVCFLWRRSWPSIDKIDSLAFLALCWAAFTLLWSKDWRQGVLELTNLSALFMIFLWVRRFSDYVAEAALCSVAVGLTLQWLFPWDWGGQGNRNFQTETIILGLLIAYQARRCLSFILSLCLTPVALWYLVFYNPSKIEFFVMAGFIVWWSYGWANARRFKLRAR